MTNFDDFEVIDVFPNFREKYELFTFDEKNLLEETDFFETYENIEIVKGGGGEIKDLPIVFEFGLLKKHNMGGWEQNSEQSDDDHFSFTFRVSLLEVNSTELSCIHSI